MAGTCSAGRGSDVVATPGLRCKKGARWRGFGAGPLPVSPSPPSPHVLGNSRLFRRSFIGTGSNHRRCRLQEQVGVAPAHKHTRRFGRPFAMPHNASGAVTQRGMPALNTFALQWAAVLARWGARTLTSQASTWLLNGTRSGVVRVVLTLAASFRDLLLIVGVHPRATIPILFYTTSQPHHCQC